MVLKHGGQLSAIARQFGLDEEGWLDLSTGVSPFSYPVPEIPDFIWQRLPVLTRSFNEAVKDYYATRDILATNGSQSVIKALPALWNYCKPEFAQVFVPEIGYKEHEKAWMDKGFEVIRYKKLPDLQALSENMILIVINPNNPTTELISPSVLNALHERLCQLNGWLVVDEAFMDVYPPQQSMTGKMDKTNLFVLRSIGKFFGLAGIRVGFVSSHPVMLAHLADFLGPWQVNGPALYIAEKALSDISWQQNARIKLADYAMRMVELLRGAMQNSAIISATPLFVTVRIQQAEALFMALCQHKVYVRLCDEKDALRFGLTDDESLKRLSKVLDTVISRDNPVK